MDLPFRERLGRLVGSAPERDDESTETGTKMDRTSASNPAEQIVVNGAGRQVTVQLPDADVDPDAVAGAIEAAAVPDRRVRVQGAAGGDSSTIPVASGGDLDLVDGAFDLGDYDIGVIDDDTIRSLQDRSVDYDSDVAEWIVAHDDLVPGIIQRVKGMLLGEEGLTVAPVDADSDADRRLAEHMRQVYSGGADLDPDVSPADVVDSVLAQNVMFGVWVGRATDLQRLDVDSLNYIKDGATGEEVYVQNRTGFVTIDVDEETDDVDAEFEYTDGERALRVGEEVLDVQLFRTPPLLAVADDVVNKLQTKRLKARKAEIASIGGLYIKIEPPEWLNEAEYQDRVPAEDHPFGEQPMKRLEVVLRQEMESALDTLESYQTATVMSVPENWTVETIQLPEMETSMDDQIRGYNEAIARRLLLPFDLMELEQGSELSRDSMLAIVLQTLAGWQRHLADLFDDFARIQAEIHGLDGSVEHSLPSLSTEDEAQIVKLLNFAGLLGLSEAEARDLVGALEGVDLPTEDLSSAPPAGRPMNQEAPTTPPGQPDEQDTEAAGKTSLEPAGLPDDQQECVDYVMDRTDLDEESAEYVCGHMRDPGKTGSVDADDAGCEDVSAYTPPDGLDLSDLEGWDQASVWDAYLSVGASFTSCTREMSGEVRNPEGFCAALKDQALGTDLWRKGAEASVAAALASGEARLLAASSTTITSDGSLDDVAGTVSKVLEDNADAQVTELASDDDFVAWSVGGVDPREDDVDDGTFEPVVLVDAGDGEFQLTGVDDGDDLLDGLDDQADVQARAALAAEHAFAGFDSVREAAQHVREIVARQLDTGETVTMRPTEQGYQLVIHDDAGDFIGSLTIRPSELQDDEFVVSGTREFFDPLRAARATAGPVEALDAIDAHVAAADPDTETLEETFDRFTDLVNMSASELRDWVDHPCSNEASQDPEAVRERVVDVLETDKADWTQATVAKASKIIGFIERMRDEENRPDDINDGAHGCPSDWVIALMNWGHRPDGVELPQPNEVDI